MNDKFSKIGFILAVAGSAVGLGNAWKFPTLVGTNGGSAFIILYLLLTFLVSFVIFLGEISIGKLSGKDPVNAYKMLAPKNAKFWSLAGFCIVGSVLIFSFYSVIMGWILKYCVSSVYYLPTTVDESGAVFSALLTSDLGVILFYYTVSVLLTFWIVSKGIVGGIERLNVWMMPALFIFLVIMLLFSFSMSGFSESAKFMLKPDFSALNKDSVLAALGLAFFTLSLGVGTIITYAASLPDKTDILKSSLSIVFINILIGVMMGLIVFTFIFEFGADPKEQGPGLVFISLATLFSKLGIVGNIFAVMFFVSLFFAALTSAVSMIEPSALYLINTFKMSRKKALSVILAFVYIMGVLCIFSYQATTSEYLTFFGKSFFDCVDYFTSNILMPISGILIAIFVGYIMNKSSLEELFIPYTGEIGFKIWYILLRTVAPLAVAIIMINQIFFS
ncbi:sodium-dependent transporter [Campylobacter corcagiensis]|uniref:Sodium-dependent transporter n=1 Tax=Campylobacter corcagiensis TaxID=1448857 RepID=A0A7M1LFM9_9BACT|nr:sodium-dependent transporter [Campylobacter corcagiensis]QKF64468.1 sodium-dependent transporter, SNF family [Campylobacter corcagiensis]QOQ87348.1 sodium-dependent transporter [Campylobacter corcagiensis]